MARMPKREKTFDESLSEFVNQLKIAGVKDKTITKVLEDINEYQQKEIKKMMKDVFKRMQKVVLESKGDE